MANVAVLCEESQVVVIEFRKLRHNAFSFDLQECSGGHPEWHIVCDAIEAIKGGWFTTQDGTRVFIDKWNLIIAFPPCTYMSNAGARWMYPKAGVLCPERHRKAMQAKDFFMKIYNSDVELIGMENPQPLKVVGLPKPTQVIQPYEFGHRYSKKTFLWLKNLPPLLPTYFADTYEPYLPSNTGGAKRGQKARIKHITQKDRSKTFPGVASAMALQWNRYLTTPNANSLDKQN